MSTPDPTTQPGNQPTSTSNPKWYSKVRWKFLMWTFIVWGGLQYAPYRGILANSPGYWDRTPALSKEQIQFGTYTEDVFLTAFGIGLLIAFAFLCKKPTRIHGILGLVVAAVIVFLEIRYSSIFMIRH